MSRDAYNRNHEHGQPKRYLMCQDPFWPRVELGQLRARLGLCADISDTQLEVAARVSMEVAAQEFADWRRCLRERGYRQLADVAGHEHGRALSNCYLRLVEGWTRLTLRRQTREIIVDGASRAATAPHCSADPQVSSSRRRSS